jgi:hypothetical protein
MSRFLLGCIEKTIANAYGQDTTKGLSYINHQENDKKILTYTFLSIKASTSSARQHSEYRLGTLMSP